MSLFPDIDVSAIRSGAYAVTHASTSFAVQLLKLTSEIRDNTARVSKHDRITGKTVSQGTTTEVLRVPTGQAYELKNVAWLAATAGVIALRVNGTLIAGCALAFLNEGISFPLVAGSVVQLTTGAGTGDVEVSLVYTVIGDTRDGKPGPWNVEYTSVDNIGVRSSIHLDGYSVDGEM